MNMFSTEATKQTSQHEPPGDKSVSKHLQGLSLTGNNSSVDKHIEEEIVERNQQAIANYNPQTIEIHRKIVDLEPLRLNIPRTTQRSTSNEKNYTGNTKEQTPQRPSSNIFGITPSSVDKGVTKYNNKKRKSDRLTRTQERGRNDPLLSNITKKVKITPGLNPNPSFFDEELDPSKNISDCSLGSQDNGMTMRNGNKENFFMNAGRSKITDFFSKTRELIEQASHSKESMGSKSKFLTTNIFSAIPEEVPAWDEERNRLIERVHDLEDKLSSMKKEREKDKAKAEMALERMKDEHDEYKVNVHKLLAKFSLEIENYKRMERKTHLNQQKQRLGEYVSQRGGSKFVDVWSDGQEIRQVKECLATINADKEELERQKKALKSKKTVIGVTKSTHTDVQLSLSGSYLGFFGDNNDSNSITDMNENKERINAKMAMLTREETELRDRLEKLEAEKALFYQQFKKQYEEDHSRYGKPNQETNSPAWPILQNRYQLLSLLGKGGFSEVYKAYDLEKFRFTACKLHQLNPNWTENAKANYVKHANREFEVHKELNHPNIVRLYDCLHIDDNSFATVLEYCEGQDLSGYLKQHKILPEREARIIIRQIICGLKYLNEHKTKIIHYDLKPQNVIFHKGEIKISDFGLCKVLESDETRIELTSQGVGTYWYLPPECFEMDDNPPLINSKVDVWSVGVMFYEMLFGMRPFGHNMSQEKILKEQVILKSYSVNIPSKPVVSNEAKEFIKKCLAYRQEDRYDVDQAYNSVLFSKSM